MKLDLLIRDARVHTMDPQRPRARHIGILNGAIVGIDDGIEEQAAIRTIDGTGTCVLPGFVDAHTHLVWQGMTMRGVDISGARSADEALHVIDTAARSAGPGWVDVVGYDQRRIGRHLGAHELDTVSHGHRVLLTHVSGHACVVNSSVLATMAPAAVSTAAGVDRDEHGRPSGLFLETAQSLVRSQRLPYSVTEISDALVRSAQLCLRQGITTCCEAGIGAGLAHHSPVELAVYQQLVRQRRLPIRVQVMVVGDFLHPLGESGASGPDLGLDLGMHTGFGSDRLSLGAIKLWLDGGMSARTAALTQPYVDSPGRGQLTEKLDAYREIALAAHTADWQLALHAIGDRAIDLAIELFDYCQTLVPRPQARPRIEHCGLARPDQLDRLAEAGITVVIQPSFLYDWGEDYSTIMGRDRAGWLYRGRAFLDHGVRMAGSSDRPVSTGSPLEAVSFMVTRMTARGALIGPDEAITVDEALRAYTVDAAYACGLEDRLGSIRVGRLADLCVLSADPYEVAVDRIRDIPVAATIVGGDVAHVLRKRDELVSWSDQR